MEPLVQVTSPRHHTPGADGASHAWGAGMPPRAPRTAETVPGVRMDAAAFGPRAAVPSDGAREPGHEDRPARPCPPFLASASLAPLLRPQGDGPGRRGSASAASAMSSPLAHPASPSGGPGVGADSDAESDIPDSEGGGERRRREVCVVVGGREHTMHFMVLTLLQHTRARHIM